ncbi:hypothetical protein LguiB_028032 [Lonicera macranthoides]
MKDYGAEESWSKYIVITHIIFATDFDTYEPIMIKDNGEILMISNNDSIMLYDPKSKAFVSEITIFGISSEFRGISHVPSLMSLKDVAEGENLKDEICNRPTYLGGKLTVYSGYVFSANK